MKDTLLFGNTLYLWALLLLLPLSWLFYWAQRQRTLLLQKIIAPRLREALVGNFSLSKRILRFGFLLLALAFLIIALAKPRFGYEEHEVKSHGRDVIMAIDVSRSMLAIDVTPTRLARAQLLGQDVLALLPGDRIGLIAFAGSSFLEAPMTLDHTAIRDALAELDTALIPKGGTNIADAIQLAITAFGKSEGTDRALVLITDGEELEADGVAAAKEAAAQGIKIFTIGIGSEEGSLIPIKNEMRENDFVRDEHGKPVLSKLDVSRLKEIAGVTGGFYQPYGTDAAQIVVQKGILPLAETNASTLTARRPIERYEWPLSAALFFLSLWCLLNERRRKNRSALALLFLGIFCCGAQGKAATGIDAYKQGNYPAALEEFEKQLQSGAASDAVRFDAGTAAYQQQDYKKAERYFTDAMTSSSPKIQQAATYNLANTLVREGEASQEKSEKLSDWNNALQHYETVLKGDPKNQPAKENRDLVKKMIEKLKQEKEPEPPKNQPQQSPQDHNNKENKKDQNNKDKNQSSQNQQSKDQDKNQKKDQQNNPSQNNSGGGNGTKPDATTPPKDSQQQGNGSSSPDQNQKAGEQPTPTPTPSNNGSGSDNSNGTQPAPTPSASPNEEKSSSANQSGKQDQPQNQAQASPSQANSPQNTPSSNNQKTAPRPGSVAQPTPSEKKSGELSGGAQKQAEPLNAAAAEEETNNAMTPSQAEAVLRSVGDEEAHVQFQDQKKSEETTRDW